jgi:hypothetical protein
MKTSIKQKFSNALIILFAILFFPFIAIQPVSGAGSNHHRFAMTWDGPVTVDCTNFPVCTLAGDVTTMTGSQCVNLEIANVFNISFIDGQLDISDYGHSMSCPEGTMTISGRLRGSLNTSSPKGDGNCGHYIVWMSGTIEAATGQYAHMTGSNYEWRCLADAPSDACTGGPNLFPLTYRECMAVIE